ncbi:SUR7/PalI family-domain-containing protein [Xylariales sp. PMI_506]|nr:SUR7/PalI family-domain-containing protein [Xylariales sp. PMI_506]
MTGGFEPAEGATAAKLLWYASLMTSLAYLFCGSGSSSSSQEGHKNPLVAKTGRLSTGPLRSWGAAGFASRSPICIAEAHSSTHSRIVACGPRNQVVNVDRSWLSLTPGSSIGTVWVPADLAEELVFQYGAGGPQENGTCQYTDAPCHNNPRHKQRTDPDDPNSTYRRRPTSVSPTSDGAKSGPDGSQLILKRATRTRRNAIFVSCFSYLLAVIFLILVEIGNTSGTKVLGDIYFFKLDLSDILATSLPSSTSLTLTNSIARSLGLHDFYQVGLWNFCEGYDTDGITSCSKPESLYWFNPVEILQSELLAGASIALPSEVNTILKVLRIASQVMFGFFISGLVLDFVLMFAAPIVLNSRWWSLPFAFLAFIAALMVTAASIVATAMALVFKYALTSQSELNIGVVLGTKMFAFMWIGAGCTLLSFIIHAGLGCCCTSRRDIRTGRRGTNHLNTNTAVSEKPKREYQLPKFSRRADTVQ